MRNRKQDTPYYLRVLKMTISEARNKLGKKGKKMSDEQIEKLIKLLDTLCNKVIDNVIND